MYSCTPPRFTKGRRINCLGQFCVVLESLRVRTSVARSGMQTIGLLRSAVARSKACSLVLTFLNVVETSSRAALMSPMGEKRRVQARKYTENLRRFTFIYRRSPVYPSTRPLMHQLSLKHLAGASSRELLSLFHDLYPHVPTTVIPDPEIQPSSFSVSKTRKSRTLSREVLTIHRQTLSLQLGRGR
ncbi:hypothetical protein EDB89DRAFT_1391233 [Lactarius sanguifluus]|nr:hypothetical protein EDB89DRAFT_1391233 [Lactarius sanguifluus]